jgi:hypothetical protein
VTRAAAKTWSWRNRAPPQLIPNCKFIIELLDFFEEQRSLSSDELQARETCKHRLTSAIKERAAFWKQRSKFKAIKESDANTAFHHAQATVRHRSNKIRAVECQGQLFTNHDAKMTALSDFFASIIGQPGESTWHFHADTLYSNVSQPSQALVAPFADEEIKSALVSMNRNSAPGPDGFGPAFYVATWATVKNQVIEFMNAFHIDDVQLERINRSYMVLIPKKPGATAVDAFRPICLQNCSVKILAKTLTVRLPRNESTLSCL